ncbi:BREX-1 system phosphatase PglZ type B [Synechococcus lacustris C3-12m-Tous]|uniref:BREX-1 system phosphatase PglZ type B n=1 Tax=Synechococcus lacustris TaxID=2116544 RepID=UPI0020CBC40E|nr:BREX-1 system phosphatase PglZ type B [Synechococcus lacustris]MCP9925848.1 BREX-1 system phosphatase PglZ type B [Synechococcus lacustris C3-12m-Tous]
MPRTLLEALAQKLQACHVHGDAEEPPVATLWTDPRGEWKPLIPLLRQKLPELLCLGDYDPEQQQGPALWLRCLVDGSLPPAEAAAGKLPVIYLPGISRQELRAGEGCPWTLEPLIELMFRGSLWLQRNGRDWTLPAFLGSSDALGLDLSGDQATKAALSRALAEVASVQLEQLRGKRLEAEDFNAYLVPDSIRDLLQWMADPPAFQQRCSQEQWAVLSSTWKKELKFDPTKDGEISAAERLAKGQGGWDKVWQRFAENPTAFPGIPELLRRVEPEQMGLAVGGQDLSRWPSHNAACEDQVLAGLQALTGKSHAMACRCVRDLENQHRERRSWIWAQLGLSPMAKLLEPLGLLAQRADQPLVGTTPEEFIAPYTTDGWEADLSAWQAVAMASTAEEDVVRRAVADLLRPWLDDTASRFQKAVASSGLPAPADQGAISAAPGEVLFFADGLRYDVARQLQKSLEVMGITGSLTTRWAGLPTVTATAKPAITPLISDIQGQALPEDFAPTFRSGKPTSAAELRKALTAQGYTVLGDDDLNIPSGPEARGWLEIGDLDHRGHQLQNDLPRQIQPEIERLAFRIQKLLEAGWRSVKVVTDHGWLFCPDGLPTAELPKHLTSSKWARCAAIKGDSQVPVPTAAWSWNPSEQFATPSGAACFNTGGNYSYAHGGISLQECLTPVLVVSGGVSNAPTAAISEISWKGLRCNLEVSGGSAGMTADLRREAAGGPSVATTAKPIDDGGARLLVEDDELEGAVVVAVLLSPDGRVIAQRRTVVGGDNA